MGLSLKPWIGISFGLRDLTIVHLAKLHATFSVLLRKDNSTTLTRFYNYVLLQEGALGFPARHGLEAGLRESLEGVCRFTDEA